MGEIEGLGGSVLRAVLEAYPDIGLQEHLFSHNPGTKSEREKGETRRRERRERRRGEEGGV